MTRKEAERLTMQQDVLRSLGFTQAEADSLRRISMTLHRWHELECGDGFGHIERNKSTGEPFYHNDRARFIDPHDPRAWHRIPDRETGAKKRLARIIDTVNKRKAMALGLAPHWEPKPIKLDVFIQTDPRGAALYILRPGDVPEGEDVSSYYSRGICVY